MSVSEPGFRWERLLPLSGAAFTGLMVLGTVAFPMPPGGDVSPASQPAWLAAHYNAVIAQSYVRGLAAVAFIAAAVAVAFACRRALGENSPLPVAALIGGALSGALLLISQAVSLAAALFAHTGGSADTILSLGRLQDSFLDLSSLPGALLFGAVGLAALRSSLLPRWLAILSLFGVPLAVIDALAYDGGPLEAVGLLGLVYVLTWALLTGVRLYLGWRADDRRTAAAESPLDPAARLSPR
jgi:hypothetical protein